MFFILTKMKNILVNNEEKSLILLTILWTRNAEWTYGQVFIWLFSDQRYIFYKIRSNNQGHGQLHIKPLARQINCRLLNLSSASIFKVLQCC